MKAAKLAFLSLLLGLPGAALAQTTAAAPVIASFSAVGPGDSPAPGDPAAGAGPMNITFSDGTSAAFGLETDAVYGDQVGFLDVQLSPDKTTLGYLESFDDCIQPSPCAMELSLWRGGKVVYRFRPQVGMVWGWQFSPDGRAIYVQTGYPQNDTVGVYHEILLGSGREAATYDPDNEDGQAPPPAGGAGKPASAAAKPDWVANFRDPTQ
ncbi:hypothetical protein [Acidocella sp.]|uniref:hypothetical protein n=1 Tax=Acidocella sp. TaxID=50710 RepID=UPI0026359091|nr:hypothetical protein [Acidocella sp.]